MKTRYALATLLLLGLATAVPAAQINYISAETGRRAAKLGKLGPFSKTEVVIQVGSGKPEAVAVNSIISIQFDDQPPQMTLLYSALANANYNAAAEQLQTMAAAKVSDARVREELTYYQAYVKAKTATNPTELKDARAGMLAFLNANANSWHYFEAVEVLGDLMLAIAPTEGDALRAMAYTEAIDHYTKLGQAPWADYKMRSANARGRAYRQSGKVADAKAAYEEAIRLGEANAKDPLVAPQLLKARVGLADTQSEDDPAAGIKLINDVIKGADPEDTELHAQAFLTIGKCHKKAGDDKQALFNFLKVDLLYFRYPEYRAEALFHLQELWNKQGQPTRAREASTELKERYPTSVWAAMLNK